MNIGEFNELYDEIMDNHSWESLGATWDKDNKDIKYCDISIDTRTGEIWRVVFRGLSGNKIFQSENLLEEIKEWLSQ